MEKRIEPWEIPGSYVMHIGLTLTHTKSRNWKGDDTEEDPPLHIMSVGNQSQNLVDNFVQLPLLRY